MLWLIPGQIRMPLILELLLELSCCPYFFGTHITRFLSIQKWLPHFLSVIHSDGQRDIVPAFIFSSHWGVRDLIKLISIFSPHPQGHAITTHFGF